MNLYEGNSKNCERKAINWLWKTSEISAENDAQNSEEKTILRSKHIIRRLNWTKNQKKSEENNSEKQETRSNRPKRTY